MGALTFFSSKAAFVGALPSFGVEDFEDNVAVPSYNGTGTPTPVAGTDLVFLGSSITGSYNSGIVVDNSAGGSGGRFNTTQPIPPSKNYLLVPGGSFTINFSSPIKALGFEATDLGDFTTTPFTVTLTPDSQSFPSIAAPLLGNDGGTGSNDGRNNFYGFIGTNTYSSVTLTNNSEDIYGLDDIIVYATSSPAIPEPSSVSVWIAMVLCGLTLVRRKR